MNEKINLTDLDIKSSIPTPPPLKKDSNLIVYLLIGIIVLLLVVIAAIVLKPKDPILVPPEPSPTPALVNSTPTSIPTITAQLGEFGKITYLSAPEKVSDPKQILLPLKPDTGGYAIVENNTYKVANFSSGAELLVVPIQSEGPGFPYYYRIIKQKDQYYLVESLINESYIKTGLKDVFRADLIKFISYPLTDLLPPSSLRVNEITFNTTQISFGASQFVTGLKSKAKLFSTDYGDLITVDDPVTELSDVFQRTIYLQLHDFTLIPYRPYNSLSLTDDKVPQFTVNGVQNTDQYISAIVPKCGGDQYQTLIKNNSPILSNKTPIGRTGNSSVDDVYQVKDQNNKLVQFLYKQYSITSPAGMSLEQYANSINHIIVQNKFGDWDVYANTKFAMQAECGKPVVYLYPLSDTLVSVKVGANVTKSEPLYPLSGWHVLAHPNGQLEYQNNTYPNLFWEGTGFGPYPNKSNYGFVVAQSKLVSTIKSQLSQLGLNTQELADFMEYWQPLLPTTPYVRLTWFNTEEMNLLAPLQVSPMPKTTIRVFLEFEGLDQPKTLIPQKLTSVKRVGFTLVEWGGLLRSHSN